MSGEKIAQRNAFGEALLEVGRKNNNLYVVTSDMGGPTKIRAFREEFPDRYVDTGIAEQNAISICGGLGLGGLRPFYVTFGVFAASNFGQIRQSIAYNKAPAVIVGTHGGLIGQDGATHQALEEITLMSSLPGMNIFQPADPLETKQIVKFLANNKMMAYLRVSRHPQENVHGEDYKFEFNKASKLIKNKNPRAAILSTGYITTHAVEASNSLAKEGIYVDVVNFSTLKPFDRESVIEQAKRANRIITLEDHNINGGIGSRVCEVLAEEGISSKVKRLGMTTFGESGTPTDLYRKFGLDAQGVVRSVRDFI